MKRVKFGDIVREVKVQVDRNNNPYLHYVAGDHMDSMDLTIRRKGSFATDDVGPAFIRIFKPGQVLYGSRRTYLKKIAVADFEGICSNTTFVLETKDSNVFLQELLPFVMLSESFTKWSISHSKGSTNPYVLFSDLANYEFTLPSLSEQKVLADKLWAAYRVKESYKKLLAATDDMLNAKFHEMFGTADMSRYSLNDVAEVYDGTHQTPNYVSQGIRFVSVEDVTNTATTVKYISKEAFEKYKHKPQKGDLLMTRIGSIGKCAVVSNNEPLAYYVSLALIKPNHDLVLSEYLKCYIESSEGQRELYQRSLLRAFPMKINLGEIGKIKIILPSLGNQQKFVEIATQAEATKESLRKSIENIDQVIKSLINQ